MTHCKLDQSTWAVTASTSCPLSSIEANRKQKSVLGKSIARQGVLLNAESIPGNTIDRLSFGISVDGQRLLPAPSWPGLAWLGLRPVVLVARAQHALGSNLSDLEMHATSAESAGSCVRCTHCPSRADSRCSPGNSSSSSSSIARAECIPMKRAS